MRFVNSIFIFSITHFFGAVSGRMEIPFSPLQSFVPKEHKQELALEIMSRDYKSILLRNPGRCISRLCSYHYLSMKYIKLEYSSLDYKVGSRLSSVFVCVGSAFRRTNVQRSGNVKKGPCRT